MSFLLDVTLRDGGYQNRFQFSPVIAGCLARQLSEAGVDFIEIGYRRGSLKPIQGIGPAGLCEADYVSSIRRAAPKAKLAVMVHPHNLRKGDLEQLRELGVDMIRVCINQKDLEATAATVREAKELGFLTTANITRVTYLQIQEVVRLAIKAQEWGADVIYFADSNGHMIPQDVAEVTAALRRAVDRPIGFHAHNNLSLALANSLAALSAGAAYVDGSLKGMGKGAGNLATEIFAAYQHRIRRVGQLQVAKIVDLAQCWELQMADHLESLSAEELFLGSANFSAEFIPVLRQVSADAGVAWAALAFALSEKAPRAVNLAEIHALVKSLTTKSGDRDGASTAQAIA